MTNFVSHPESDEIEVCVFGPGYGECILIHIGNQKWIVVDSCFDDGQQSAALGYLNGLGLDVSEAVCLLVVTHWHDDHIRGIRELVQLCDKAVFSCASALGEIEFLSVLAALEGRSAIETGSGMREIFGVFSLLAERSATCKFAVADRILLRRGDCEIWSLSPSDRAYQAFLQQVGQLASAGSGIRRRVSTFRQNHAAVVMLINIGDITILLGSDLPRRGWAEVLSEFSERNCRSSMFKVPHHGSRDAHEDRVWTDMLGRDPVVVLTPWRRGGRELPTELDARRILALSGRAYITSSRDGLPRVARRYHDSAVTRTVRETGASIRSVRESAGMIRLRKKVGDATDWKVEKIGSACTLEYYW